MASKGAGVSLFWVYGSWKWVIRVFLGEGKMACWEIVTIVRKKGLFPFRSL